MSSTPTLSLHSASPSSTTSIEPIHSASHSAAQQPPAQISREPGHAGMGGLGVQKGFLMKKMAQGGSFHSPTDTMVSPCTKKLVQAKGRHYIKGKPLSLSSQFQASQSNNGPSKMQQSSSALAQSSAEGQENVGL